MRLFKRKTITVPTVEKEDLDAAELWDVRWTSRYGSFHGDTQPEMEVFFSEEEANRFKTELEDAFKLIRHTSGNKVEVNKRK